VKLISKRVNHLIGEAMHTYAMLNHGDRVMVAVSGGIDSLVLAWILDKWRLKSPIDYELLAVHLDMGFEENQAHAVEKELRQLKIPYHLEITDLGRKALEAEDGRSGCFHCARQRRIRLFQLAESLGFNKLAFGHHKEDIIETFFLNLLYGGNLSTMVPNQVLFQGRLTLIRPLAFLEKKDIEAIGSAIQLTPVPNPCPLAVHSRREKVRRFLAQLYREEEMSKSNIFAALSNVKTDYLLRPSRS